MVAAFLNDGMPTMMSAPPRRATSSRICWGRADDGIAGTLPARRGDRLGWVLEDQTLRVYGRNRLAGVHPPRQEVHLPVGGRDEPGGSEFVLVAADHGRVCGRPELDPFTDRRPYPVGKCGCRAPVSDEK